MRTTSFNRFAAVCAVLAGLAGLLYALSFLVLQNAGLSALFLLLGGLLSTPVLVALYERLRDVDAGLALWAAVLGLAGVLGAALHGGYDLANAIHPPATNPIAEANLPSAVDPRGLLTFGVTAVSILALAWLLGRSREFPRGLSLLGYLLGVLLAGLYVGRLVILDPTHPLVAGLALVTGFLLNPAWYIWVGATLWTGREPATNVRTGASLNF